MQRYFQICDPSTTPPKGRLRPPIEAPGGQNPQIRPAQVSQEVHRLRAVPNVMQVQILLNAKWTPLFSVETGNSLLPNIPNELPVFKETLNMTKVLDLCE